MPGSDGPEQAADAVGAVGHGVGVEEHDRHDLAEAEGDDREVVAAQPQGRRAQQDAEQSRRRTAPTSSIGQNRARASVPRRSKSMPRMLLPNGEATYAYVYAPIAKNAA